MCCNGHVYLLATQRELPRGAIVVHNTLVGYADSTRYRLLQSYEVATSWNPAHEVHVHVVV